MNNKAQYSKVDRVVWYGLCIIVITIAVASLYSLDMIGNGSFSEKITAAATFDEVDGVKLDEEIVDDNSTIITDG